MSNTLWSDIESSGLSSTTDVIVEIAFILDNLETKKLSEYKTYIKHKSYPKHYDNVCKEVHGLYPQFLEKNGVTPATAMIEIKDFFLRNNRSPSGMILAGYNIGFDKRFLETFFTMQGYPVPMESLFTNTIDVLDTVKEARKKGVLGNLINNKLVTVAEALHIEFDSHSAMSDIKTTKYIYDFLKSKMGES